MFSFDWFWGSQANKPEEVAPSSELNLEEVFDDFDDVTQLKVIPLSQLKSLKRSALNVDRRTYYLINSGKDTHQLYCVDKGVDKAARKIDINNSFIKRIAKIDPELLKPVVKETDVTDLLQRKKVGDDMSEELGVQVMDVPVELQEEESMIVTDVQKKSVDKKVKKLRELIGKRDGIIFQVVTEKNFNTAGFAKNVEKDAYFLVKGKSDLYQLNYYDTAKKIKIPLLAYEKSNGSYDSLPELREDATDKSIFDNVCMSEEGLEGFAGLMNTIFKSEDFEHHQTISTEDLNRMREFLDYYHEPLPTPNLYQKLTKVIIQIRNHINTLIENTLDPYYFNKYFRNAQKDKDGKFIIPKNDFENAQIINYLTFLNMLVDMELFFKNTSKVHGKIIQPIILYNLLQSSGPLLQNCTALLSAYNFLYGYLEPIGMMTFLRNVSSTSGLKHELKKIIPLDLNLAKQQLTTNPFYLSHLNQGENWLAMVQGTEDKINALQKILNDLSKNLPRGGQANENIQKTISDINTMLLQFNRFHDSPKKLLDILRLIYDVHPKITGIIKGLPKSSVSLQTVFKDHILMTAQQLNLLCRDVFLNLDKFEIDNHLKKGLLTEYEFAEDISFIKMMEDFHKTILDAGYEFKPDEIFPYSNSLIQQRKLMLTYPNPAKAIIISRIKQTETEAAKSSNAEKHRSDIQAELNNKNDQIDLAIDGRINQLKEEASTWMLVTSIAMHQLQLLKNALNFIYLREPFERAGNVILEINRWFNFSNVRQKKIRLLEKLKAAFASTKSIDAALQVVYLNNPLDRESIPLLWRGRTGKMLRELQVTSAASPLEIVHKITVEVNKLKQLRAQRIRWFANSKRRANEKKILAFAKLQQLLLKPGVTVDSALNELNAVNPQEYRVLITKEKAFFEELKQSNSHISALTQGKELVDYIHPTKIKLTPREVHIKYGYVKMEIDKRIKQLNKELASSYFSNTVKQQKIAILQDLKIQLNHRPLEAALENIASSKEYQKTFFLLREGRTGILLDNLELSDVTPTEKSKYVDHAIQRLKRMRAQPYSLFSEPEQFIEARIYALSQLKEKMLGNPELPLTEALNLLFTEQKNLLVDHEPHLFNTLRQWDILAEARGRYDVSNPPAPNAAPANPYNVEEKAQPSSENAEIRPSPVTNETVYKTTLTNIEFMERQAKDLFKAMLDPKVYEKYFTNRPVDAEGRYIIPDHHNYDPQIVKYMKFFNVLINSKILFTELDKLHPKLIIYDGTWLGTIKLLPQIPAMYTSGSRVADAYYNLYHDVDEHELFALFDSFTADKHLAGKVKSLIPAKAMSQFTKISKNPFFQTINKDHRVDTKALKQHLANFSAIFLKLENELPASKIARDSFKKTAEDVANVIKETNKFGKTAYNLVDALKFVYDVYPHLTSLINNSGQTYGTLNVLFKEHMIIAMLEVNALLKDLVLSLDRFKVNQFLVHNGSNDIMNYEFQKGVSLGQMIKTFNSKIESMGYEFKPEERYPYHQAILEQRRQIKLENMLPHPYIADIVTTHQAIMADTQEKATQDKAAEELRLATRRNDAIITLLDLRIAELTREKGKWYNFAKTRDIKINLLNEFKTQIQQFPSFEFVIKKMEQSRDFGDDLHLLMEGRTGTTIIQVQQNMGSIGDVLALIDHEIVDLKHTSQNIFSFASLTDANTLQQGLQRLRNLLSSKGYNLDSALAEMSGKYPEEYAMLFRKQTPLLDKIKGISAFIPDSEIGKKILDDTTASARIKIHERYDDSAYINNLIDQRIELLRQELNQARIYKSPSKLVKIALLVELKKQLEGHSLEDSLEAIAKNKTFSLNISLLYEGRTGKLIKKLETVILTKAEMIQRIEAEINYLKLDKKSSSLFYKAEKNKLEHIIILEDLRDKLNQNPELSLKDFLGQLHEKQRTILKQDSRLFAEIHQWQNAKAETIRMQPRRSSAAGS